MERVKLLLDAGVQVNVQNDVSAVLIKLQVTKLYLGRCTQALQPMRKRRDFQTTCISWFCSIIESSLKREIGTSKYYNCNY